MQGHVDGVGTIASIRPVGDSWWVYVDVSPELMRYVVTKGSVTVDGISLTVADSAERTFAISVIPHTWDNTTLKDRRAGDTVNVETDILGKYVEKMLGGYLASGGDVPGYERVPQGVHDGPSRPRRLRRHRRAGGSPVVEILEKTEAPPEIHFDTFEEWLAWSTRQEERTELEDGKVIFVHRDTRGEYVGVKVVHQILLQYLYEILRHWLRTQSINGLLLFAPIAMRTPQRRRYGREPDLLYLAPERLDRVRETYIEGAADLCVEIVSPESEERDRDVKFLEYQEAGVREYWLIDPDARSAQFWRLDETGQYRGVPLTENGIFVCDIIPGLTLRPSWLWEEILPAPSAWEALWNEQT